MPYLSRYLTDLFLSYGHLDNTPSGPDEQRWISRFHADLERRINQYLGAQINIWRDNLLSGSHEFPAEIARNLASTAAWIPVLSPRFLSSDWCSRELRIFLDSVQNSGGLKIGTRSRIFKVVKTAIALSEQPEAMQQVLGYDFFRLDENNRPRELPDFDLSPDAEKRYLVKVDDLAYDLHLLLKEMKALDTPSPVNGSAPPEQAGDAVYVAETTQDLWDSRDQIRRELQAKGYRVLPDCPLPPVAGALLEIVSAQMAECRLSVHPVGERYGFVPEGTGETRSVVWLQHQLALQRKAKGKFQCLLWQPSNAAITDPRQQQFIAYIQEQLRENSSFEVLKTSLEALKNHVFDQLAAETAREVRVPDKHHIYLICEQRDAEAVKPLQEYLTRSRMSVVLPLWDGDQTEIRTDHEETLQDCDSVLIYHGSGSAAWIREKERDLRRARGRGRTRPFMSQGIYLGPDETPAKAEYNNSEFVVMRNFGAFSPRTLDPFVSALVAAVGATA
jgi:hypothetical protein